LLGGDYDEEARQSSRIQQKERNALEGAKSRLDAETVAKISGLSNSRTNSMRTGSMRSQRTGSVGSQPGTPQNKYDPKLKRALMAHQEAEMEKAARDVKEAREKAMA